MPREQSNLRLSSPHKLVWAGVGIVMLALSGAATSDSLPASDRKVLPPATRAVESPQGDYRLELKNPDEKTALAVLIATREANRTLWEKRLPHHHGPRVGLVGPDGTVVLLDEWINVFTKHAITVFGRDGATLAVHSTDDVAAFLSLSRAELAAKAKFGPWMRGAPFLTESGDHVAVPMGQHSLLVNLRDGSLATAPSR